MQGLLELLHIATIYIKILTLWNYQNFWCIWIIGILIHRNFWCIRIPVYQNYCCIRILTYWAFLCIKLLKFPMYWNIWHIKILTSEFWYITISKCIRNSDKSEFMMEILIHCNLVHSVIVKSDFMIWRHSDPIWWKFWYVGIFNVMEIPISQCQILWEVLNVRISGRNTNISIFDTLQICHNFYYESNFNTFQFPQKFWYGQKLSYNGNSNISKDLKFKF